MLSLTRRKPNDTDVFRVPFSGTVSWAELIKMYPMLLTEMDGECRENCLLFYYQRNPVNQIYELKDEDSELDFAEILKIDMNVTKDGESKQEKEDRKSKSCDDLNNMFKEIMQEDRKIKSCNDLNDMVREIIKEEPITPVNYSFDSLTDIKQTKMETKKAKKERRLQRLIEKEKQPL